jgi:hypothetical protein
MERGCVEDQPQEVKHPKSLVNSRALRLVEDNTAALRTRRKLISPSRVVSV